MITGSEILKDLDNILVKLKCNIQMFPNNDIWHKLYGDIMIAQESLRKDKKIYNYD